MSTEALEAAVEVTVEDLRQLATVVGHYNGDQPTLIKRVYVYGMS